MNEYQKAYAVLQKSDNVNGVVLYDQVSLASGTNFTFFPATPTAQTNIANYRKNPFPYTVTTIGKIFFQTDLSLITDAIKKVLMNANVIIRKNDNEVGRYPLTALLGLTLGATVLDTTLKSFYYSDPAKVKYLIKPVVLNAVDNLNVVVNFDATTGLTSQVLSVYAEALVSTGVISNTVR